MISLPQVLPGRNNWNIFHPRRALFQALAPKFLFSLFFPCFTPFGLISNVQKNQKKGFVFKEWNIALTFKDKGPHSFLANPFTKARTSLVAELVNNPAGEGIGYPLQYPWASLMVQTVKNLPAMWETWVRKIPWRRKWQPAPEFWPGESHGQRSLVCYSPRDHRESDTTEQLRVA